MHHNSQDYSHNENFITDNNYALKDGYYNHALLSKCIANLNTHIDRIA